MIVPGDRDRLALLVHEVRSPVAAIVAIAEAIAEDQLDPQSLRELLRLAVGACRGVERVVGDAALGSVEIDSVDVDRLVTDAVAAAALAGARVRAEVAKRIPHVEADPLRLRQALDNLIENARAHAHSEEEIVIGARAEGRSVLIWVSDKGRGIPVEEQSRIFEPGARLDPTRQGSGLGLNIVRAIAEAHNGTLSVDSAAGEGATFTITVPVRGS